MRCWVVLAMIVGGACAVLGVLMAANLPYAKAVPMTPGRRRALVIVVAMVAAALSAWILSVLSVYL